MGKCLVRAINLQNRLQIVVNNIKPHTSRKDPNDKRLIGSLGFSPTACANAKPNRTTKWPGNSLHIAFLRFRYLLFNRLYDRIQDMPDFVSTVTLQLPNINGPEASVHAVLCHFANQWIDQEDDMAYWVLAAAIYRGAKIALRKSATSARLTRVHYTDICTVACTKHFYQKARGDTPGFVGIGLTYNKGEEGERTNALLYRAASTPDLAHNATFKIFGKLPITICPLPPPEDTKDKQELLATIKRHNSKAFDNYHSIIIPNLSGHLITNPATIDHIVDSIPYLVAIIPSFHDHPD